MQQISAKEYKSRHDWGGEGDLLGIMQEIEIWPCKQVVYAQPRIRLGEQDTQSSLVFWDTNGSPNLNQTTWPSDSQEKTENMPNCWLYCLDIQQSKIEGRQKEI